MTATTAAPPAFADITAGRAWYRVDDVFDPATNTHTDIPALHHDLDCGWPEREGWQIVTRGGASIVEEQPFFDACDRWNLPDCPDAVSGHRRPVPVCPRCAPALTGREVA